MISASGNEPGAQEKGMLKLELMELLRPCNTIKSFKEDRENEKSDYTNIQQRIQEGKSVNQEELEMQKYQECDIRDEDLKVISAQQ